jgi:hypothetical protein
MVSSEGPAARKAILSGAEKAGEEHHATKPKKKSALKMRMHNPSARWWPPMRPNSHRIKQGIV